MVIAVPDIKSFQVMDSHDFIGLASDGIFDKISNDEFIKCVWNSVNDERAINAHQQIGHGVEYIIKNSLLRKTLDNVTVVLVAFQNFKTLCFPSESQLTSYEDSECGSEAHKQQLNPTSEKKRKPSIDDVSSEQRQALKRHRRMNSGSIKKKKLHGYREQRS